jgi:hypothetical protein
VKSELFVDKENGGNDKRIIYRSESKSAKEIFKHFVASLADYITVGSAIARNSYASLRKQFGVGPNFP